jgi:hypothetical protein
VFCSGILAWQFQGSFYNSFPLIFWWMSKRKKNGFKHGSAHSPLFSHPRPWSRVVTQPRALIDTKRDRVTQKPTKTLPSLNQITVAPRKIVLTGKRTHDSGRSSGNKTLLLSLLPALKYTKNIAPFCFIRACKTSRRQIDRIQEADSSLNTLIMYIRAREDESAVFVSLKSTFDFYIMCIGAAQLCD